MAPVQSIPSNRIAVRKWTHEQTRRILDFLLENRFEYPTAILFYQRLMKEGGFSQLASVRGKVLNMRRSYWLALRTFETNNCPLPKPGEPIPDSLLRTCPYYEDLSKIFMHYPVPELYRSQSNGNGMRAKTRRLTLDQYNAENMDVDILGADFSGIDATATEMASPMSKGKQAADKSGVEKSTFDQELRMKELQLYEKELNIWEYKVQSRERINQLKIQTKERIALKKLELQYENRIDNK